MLLQTFKEALVDSVHATDSIFIETSHTPLVAVHVLRLDADKDLTSTLIAVFLIDTKSLFAAALVKIASMFKFNPPLVFCSSIDMHPEVGKIFPDAIVRSPIFFLVRTLILNGKIPVAAHPPLLQWFSDQYRFEKEGIRPVDRPEYANEDVAPAILYAKRMYVRWTTLGMHTHHGPDVARWLWAGKEWANINKRFELFLHEDPSWSSIAVRWASNPSPDERWDRIWDEVCRLQPDEVSPLCGRGSPINCDDCLRHYLSFRRSKDPVIAVENSPWQDEELFAPIVAMEKRNCGCGPNRNWAARGIDGDSAGSVNEKAGPFLLSDGASRIAHALLRQTLEFIPLHLTNKTIETTLLY